MTTKEMNQLLTESGKVAGISAHFDSSEKRYLWKCTKPIAKNLSVGDRVLVAVRDSMEIVTVTKIHAEFSPTNMNVEYHWCLSPLPVERLNNLKQREKQLLVKLALEKEW
jgi:hypothetical protein